MSYTNQTANYGLPQYTADDKPTYLGDFNKAMLDIDTAIKNNENIAQASETLAQNANNSASEALSTANTASSSATNAGVKADNAYALAESAKADATQASTDATDAKTIANSANQTATSANATATSAQTTATNANNTATAVQSAVNNISYSKRTLIFEGPSTTNFTLTQSTNTFDELLFVYKINERNSIEQYVPATDTSVDLHAVYNERNSSGANVIIHLDSVALNINGTDVTRTEEANANIDISNSKIVGNTNASIIIEKVYGIKYYNN